jgi:hypothetical protein
MWAWLGRIKDTWSWGRFAWQLAGALGITGLVTSVGGSVWAVITGVPIPIAIMAGYCTLVGTVFLAMAPLAYRALANSPSNAPAKGTSKIAPDYKTWRHIQTPTIRQAAHLWNDRDPAEVSETADVEVTIEFFIDAIKRGDLPVALWNGANQNDYRQAKAFPDASNRVRRSDLKPFATKHGYDPIFLRDS